MSKMVPQRGSHTQPGLLVWWLSAPTKQEGQLLGQFRPMTRIATALLLLHCIGGSSDRPAFKGRGNRASLLCLSGWEILL